MTHAETPKRFGYIFDTPEKADEFRTELEEFYPGFFKEDKSQTYFPCKKECSVCIAVPSPFIKRVDAIAKLIYPLVEPPRNQGGVII